MQGIKLQLMGVSNILIGMWEPLGSIPDLFDISLIGLGLVVVLIGGLMEK